MTSTPQMADIVQRFPRPRLEDVHTAALNAVREGLRAEDLSGKRIAVACGSRGISHLDEIAAAVVSALKERGASVVLIPAMGSHGGGAAEAQRDILLEYGLREDRTGAPIISSIETVRLGQTGDGVPVFFSRDAFESDGVIVINRIKPHTDFNGAIESGILKMIAVGLGKVDGARTFHSRTTDFDHVHLIETIAGVAIQTGKILGGLAILENAYHETASLNWSSADALIHHEREWIRQAREWMPSLPIERADALIVDRIGKNISGVGLDPNVTGRRYRINRRWNDAPDITRIAVMDITPETNGNAVGVGLADFCGQRVLQKMDKRVTYVNAVTSRNALCADIPLNFDTDREMFDWMVRSIGDVDAASLRMLHISDTLNLIHLRASEALLPELREHPHVESIGELHEMEFTPEGDLPLLPWTR